MSSICGIFFRDNRKIDFKLIKQMNSTLAHRGPDGSAVWCDNSVGFGYQKLLTTPESLYEKLPFFDEKIGLAITADARIDNRKELSQALDIKDIKTNSDSYFILRAYQKWGENCPEKLLGDFAFVIWDKNKETIFCARDHMGVKPFYYYLSDEVFLFATEIKALFCIKDTPFSLNKIRVADYLVWDNNDREITFYEHIKRLPAAFKLNITYHNSELLKYWALDPNYELNLDSDDEYSQNFRNIFEEAVKCRLRCVYPVGSLLSGGLDSSSIVSMASRILPANKTLQTYSIVFKKIKESDEREYISSVLNQGNFDSYFNNGDEYSPFLDIKNYLWHLDEPPQAVGYSMFWKLYQTAKKNGVRVMLDGYEGDATVSYGTKILVDMARKFKWGRLIKEVNATSKTLKINHYSVLWSYILYHLIPFTIKDINLFYRHNDGIPRLIKELFNKDFAKNTDIMNRWKNLNKENLRNINNPKESHYLDLISGEYQSFLEEADKRAAAFSFEIRYPFFDVRLIEFCLALPAELKYFNGWDRWILRNSMKDILPEKVRWRRNKSFMYPNFEYVLLKFGKNRLNNVFNRSNNLDNYLNLPNVQKNYKKYKSGIVKNNDVDSPYNLWAMANLDLWIHIKDFN